MNGHETGDSSLPGAAGGVMSGNDAPQHQSPARSLHAANRFVPRPIEKVSEFGRALSCYRKAGHKLKPLSFFSFFPSLEKKSG